MAKQSKKIKIPKSVLSLQMSPKKFAKKNNIRLKGKGMSKGEKKRNLKRLKAEYAENAANGLNKAVKILAENDVEGKKINKVKLGVDNVISNPGVMKRVAKIYKRNPENFQNMIYLPYMIMNTLAYYNSEGISDEEKEIGKELDPEALISFCEKILKKQIKRYRNLGLDDDTAFMMATTIPTAKLFRNNRQWYSRMIHQMYDIAATKEVDIDAVIKAVMKVDKKKKEISKKDFLEGFFAEFIMQKTSNKSAKFTDTQKELHEGLIQRCLAYLDDQKPRKLRDILKRYIKRRKTAEEYKHDGRRVIKFVDHANSNSPYTTIKAVVQDLIADDAKNEGYLS